MISNENGFEIFIDESGLGILLEELKKFTKFYNLEMEISSKEIFYKFFQKNNHTDHIFSNNTLLIASKGLLLKLCLKVACILLFSFVLML